MAGSIDNDLWMVALNVVAAIGYADVTGAERLDLVRDLIESRGRNSGQLAILGLDEGGDLLEELHQRGSQTLALLGSDRRKTADAHDGSVERGQRRVVPRVGFTPLANARFEIVRCHLAPLTSRRTPASESTDALKLSCVRRARRLNGRGILDSWDMLVS